jgi:internalin A
LVVMDSERKHVASVNLSTLKSPETLDRAVALLPALPYINSLNVDGTMFRDEHAAVVGQLGSLQDLVLSHTSITDRTLEKLEALSRLKTMHLVDTAVTNAGMRSVGQLRSLNIIDVSGTKVTSNLEPLSELPALTWLVAGRLTLDAAAIDSIGNCPNLSRVSLRETTYPPEALNELKKHRPHLTIDR